MPTNSTDGGAQTWAEKNPLSVMILVISMAVLVGLLISTFLLCKFKRSPLFARWGDLDGSERQNRPYQLVESPGQTNISDGRPTG